MIAEISDRKFLVKIALVFFVTLAFTVGVLNFNQLQQPEKFRKSINTTLGGDNSVQEVKIENESVDFMLEDTKSMKVYIDKDRDGSSDLELDLTHDGRLHRGQQILTFNKTSYTLYYEYRDDSEVRGDELFRIYLIEEF